MDNVFSAEVKNAQQTLRQVREGQRVSHRDIADAYGYMNSKEYRVLRLDHFQNKETCTLCNRMGYDYKITHIPMRENRRNK